MSKIFVTIGKDGKTQIRGEGFTGASCIATMSKLEKGLGTQIREREMHLDTNVASQAHERVALGDQ